MAKRFPFGGALPVQTQTTNQTPAQADPTVPPQHSALFNTIDGLLFKGWLGYGGRAAAAQAAKANTALQTKQLQDRVQQAYGDDPNAMIALATAPDEFGKQLAGRYGAANVNGGDSRVYGDPNHGGSVYTAPKLGIDGGQAYTQTPDAMNVTGTRAPSFAEQSEAAAKAAAIDAEIQRLQIARGQLGVAQGQLGINQKSYEARLKGVGGFGTPGVGVTLGNGAMPAGEGWEVQ